MLVDLRPLRSSTFRNLTFASWIDEFGEWVGDIALALLVYDRTRSPLATAVLFLALRFAPALLAQLLTSRVAVLPPRRVLPALYMGEALIFGAIALVATTRFSLPVILVLCAADGLLGVTATALNRSASATHLLAGGMLREGNGIRNMGVVLSGALGPPLGGVLVAVSGASTALLLDAASFVVAALLVATARDLRLEIDEDLRTTRQRLGAGLRAVRERPTLQHLMLAIALVLMLVSVVIPIEVVFVKHTLHGTDAGYGALIGAWGVGMTVGGLGFLAASKVRLGTILVVSTVLVILGYAGMAASPTLLVACLFSALGGLGNGSGGIGVVTAIQQWTPMRVQSQVMAVFEGTNQVMPAIGFIIGGALTALFSPRIAYAVSAAGVAVVVALLVLVKPIGDIEPASGEGAQALGDGADHMTEARFGDRETPVGGEQAAVGGGLDVLRSGEQMKSIPEQSQASESQVPAETRGPRRSKLDGLLHSVALAAAAALAVRTADTAHWNLVWLVIIVALAVSSEMNAVKLPTGKFLVSGSFLAITLAAVVLGGPPAALVGVITIALGWFRSREPTFALRHNLATYAWFPLITGLLFHWVQRHTGVRAGGETLSADYYLMVFGAFMCGLMLNYMMLSAYASWRNRVSLWSKVAEFRPVMAAELASAVLTLIAVYLTNRLGDAGLALFALVLVIFQYLVGELLVSEHRAEELRVLATTDELTGLANRKQFGDMLDEEIKRSTHSGDAFGVLILDLNNFKEINGTLGHQYGDDLLVELAPRLAQRAGAGGVVARFGGNAFAILPAQRTADIGALGRITETLLDSVQEPLMIGEVTVQVDGAIGAARYPHDGTDAQTLLRRADVALNQAKEQRDPYRIYDPVHDHHSTRQLGMLADFRRALENDEIVLYYHPIVDLHPRRISGAEALVRWQHPQLGVLQPAAFLHIVEQTGMIAQLTNRVLDLALAECARWRQSGRELTVAANLSVRNLLDPQLPAEVGRKLRQYNLPPEALKLEITESMIMSDPERALGTARELGALGCKLAVDDFGTGHSSLANLRRLPVDELKIDRSFVTNMLDEASDMVIVRSTIDLGHALGLKVIAEGVETAEILERLGELDCDCAQGHFLSTPMPAARFLPWVEVYETALRATV